MLRLSIIGEARFENESVSPSIQVESDLKKIPIHLEIKLSKTDQKLLAEGKINVDLNQSQRKWKLFAKGEGETGRASGMMGIERQF